ncbi:MAG TPA: hypothetical protein VK923_17165 [Euzebyales bacterium]|nr:hypothetical protein [Euzebyales bacterium]
MGDAVRQETALSARCCSHAGRATVAGLVLLVSACSTPADVAASGTGPSTRPSVAAVTPNAVPSGAVESVEPQPPQPDAELRGDEQGWFAPDTTLTVFGLHTALVAHEQPGALAPVVGYLWPTDDHTATGRARAVADGLWVEVELADEATTGWVDRRFLGVAGAIEDVAAEVPAAEHTPVGADALDLGTTVLRALGYDPEGLGTTLSQDPVVRRRATVAFDVRLADDVILGERIRVIGVPTDATEGRFELLRVERTLICARAVTPDGTCR